MDNQITEQEYDALERASSEFIRYGVIRQKCPRCGKLIVFETYGSYEIIHCEDPTCIEMINRGI